MALVEAVRSRVRRALVARSPGIDLSRLDRVPERLTWPLRREGMEPFHRVEELRETKGPVARVVTFLGVEVWLVTGDAEAREMLADQTSYSTDIRPYMGKAGGTDIGGLGFTDPPDHTRLRRLLTPEFTMRRLARLKPAIDRIVEDQLDETERLGADGAQVDLAQTFAFPVPFLVICELLGLPVEEREKYRSMASARFDVNGGGVGTVGAVAGSREFLFEETARQRLDPGPGLIGQIIREHGDEITDFDLAGLADGAFTGGLETSASMLALGTAVLLERPELWDMLVAGDESVAPIVDELLRYLAVVQVSFPRFAKQDMVLGGQRIKKGAVVLAHLPAANRDPRSYHVRRLRPHAGDAVAPGLRARLPPVHRRRAGPDGAARGVPRPGPALPRPAARRRPGRPGLPRPVPRVRRGLAAGPPALRPRFVRDRPAARTRYTADESVWSGRPSW